MDHAVKLTINGETREFPMGITFFQAEDGIRDYKVTGVQTCALPIWRVGFEVGFGSVNTPYSATLS